MRQMRTVTRILKAKMVTGGKRRVSAYTLD